MDMRVDYDRAAASYAAHRRLHPGVLHSLCRVPGLGPGSRVLEVGCGTGNYLSTIAEITGCAAWGLDPSAGMLRHARGQAPDVAWLQGRAEQLGLAPRSLNLVFSVDVIHHVADHRAYFHGAARVLRPGGLICTVTDSEEIIRRREILSGYFPETVEVELARYPRVERLQAGAAEAGLASLAVIQVEAPYAITSAGPYRERAYSSLHLIPDAAWQAGLERLERDLARGPVHGTARYVCIWAQKQTDA